MSHHTLLFKATGLLIFVLGFFVGTASASPTSIQREAVRFTAPAYTYGNFFAGYYAWQSNRGSRADITWADPYAGSDYRQFTTEWVMAQDDSGHWVQMGWLKYGDGVGARYYGEYGGCSNPPCRQIGSVVPSNTTHNYKVLLSSDNLYWIGRVDNVEFAKIPASWVGFLQARIVDYSGESTYTGLDIGGTSSYPVLLNNTSYAYAPGLWNPINIQIFLPANPTAACYYKGNGNAGGLSYVNNYTSRYPQNCN